MRDIVKLAYDSESGLYRKSNNAILNKNAYRQWGVNTWTANIVQITLPTGDVRFWTGSPDLLFEGNTYLSSRLIEVQPLGGGSDIKSTPKGFRVVVSAIEDEDRRIFLTPVGLAPVRMQTLYTEDAGLTWNKIGQEIVGVIASPTLSGSQYSFTVEPRSALVDRARLRFWSHEDRIRRYGIVDQGMSQLPKLADEGITGRWPNP